MYSVRPAKVPTVSTPLAWNEINEKLDPQNFTIDTIIKRLEKKGDLFKAVNEEKIKNYNSAILKKINSDTN